MKRTLGALALCCALLASPGCTQFGGEPPTTAATAPSTTRPPNVAVVGKVKLYVGNYPDIRSRAQDVDPKRSLDFCVIRILRVDKTSFDFEIDQVSAADSVTSLFPKSTARFVDGAIAVSSHDQSYLEFTFPDNSKALPDVLHIRVSGHELLEGNDYFNANVPGHEPR